VSDRLTIRQPAEYYGDLLLYKAFIEGRTLGDVADLLIKKQLLQEEEEILRQLEKIADKRGISLEELQAEIRDTETGPAKGKK
jgi:hypothetical protein